MFDYFRLKPDQVSIKTLFVLPFNLRISMVKIHDEIPLLKRIILTGTFVIVNDKIHL